MGSTGSGNFTDYSNTRPRNGDGKTGGSSGVNKCEMAISTMLEDVERCDYYLKNGHVPNIHEAVTVRFAQRLEVINQQSMVIGYLPTKYNYLVLCINDGYYYTGFVSGSSNNGFAVVKIDLAPEILK